MQFITLGAHFSRGFQFTKFLNLHLDIIYHTLSLAYAYHSVNTRRLIQPQAVSFASFLDSDV